MREAASARWAFSHGRSAVQVGSPAKAAMGKSDRGEETVSTLLSLPRLSVRLVLAFCSNNNNSRMLNGCLNPVVPVRVLLLKVKQLILGIRNHFEDIFTQPISYVGLFLSWKSAIRGRLYSNRALLHTHLSQKVILSRERKEWEESGWGGGWGNGGMINNDEEVRMKGEGRRGMLLDCFSWAILHKMETRLYESPPTCRWQNQEF